MSLTPLPIIRTQDASLRFVERVVRVGGQLQIDDEIVAWRYIRTEAAP